MFNQKEHIKCLKLKSVKILSNLQSEVPFASPYECLIRLMFSDPSIENLILDKEDYMHLWLETKSDNYRYVSAEDRDNVGVWGYAINTPFGEITILWSGN